MSIDSSINLRNDVIFKAIFGYEKNEKLLISLLNAILGLTGNKKIVSLTFLNAFNIKEYLKDKLTILDVKAVDGTGVRFDVEMQVAPDKSYLQRIMYYLDRLFTEQLKEGVPYEKLCKAISISILDFIFFEEEGDLHNIYRFLNIKSKRELTDLKELQFIELPKFKKDKPKRDMSKFEKWLLALKFGEIYANDLENLPEELKEEEEIVMALHELVRASNDDMIREILEMRSKARHDEASRLYQAEMKGKEDVAKNLLEMDMPIEKIAKATGISVEEIEKLKQIRN
ncbi:MAG TPA: Rpn family recombination-promoting nuclease/putative transposase [Atribacterota bacterium]|nr:Rpn family recombination-promoting nuclease/putative transposase [Atribacterota bacterium]